jgi:penicillin-binding protein 1B
LDPIVQYQAEQALTRTISNLTQRFPTQLEQLQGSMVVSEPRTGEVLALIGDKNTRYQGFNRALDAVRPIGSLVKPAVYLTALENNYTLASLIDDSDFTMELAHGKVWTPKNFDKQSHGEILLIDALSHSYNSATARLGMDIGLNAVIDTLEKLGVKRSLDPFPSLLLGAQGLTPFEVTTMYQTFASNGFYMLPRSIRNVTDNEGHTLSSYPFQLKQTIETDKLYLINQAMESVTQTGTARSIQNRLPASVNVAGKTGTSDEQRDSWFAGYSANRLATVWIGLDDNKPMPITGSSGALKAWTAFMASQPLESISLPQPETIEWLWVDSVEGSLSDERCDGARPLPFIIGSAPVQESVCKTQLSDDPVSKSLDWIKSWF